jgi:hypothetical protein
MNVDSFPKNPDREDSTSDRRRSLRLDAEEGIGKPNVKVAETLEEYEAAFRLAHDVYVGMGYFVPQASGLRVILHHGLPDTLVFLVRDERNVLGTVTLVPDGVLGLPMDDLYRDELDGFRRQGKKIFEVAALVADPRFRKVLVDDTTPRRGVFWLLHQAVFWWARHKGADHLLITVNPRHAWLYTKLYGFQQFGEVRSYDKVQGAPAVPLQLDLTALPEKLERAVRESEKDFQLKKFFYRLEHGFGEGNGRLPGMPPELVRHFLRDRTDLLATLSRTTADIFARALGFDDFDCFSGRAPSPSSIAHT